ncbi:hypothetical protein BJ875DRAFT_441229 [Amylocarpus encephaloides]|uniref:UBX domain-containing protein n=1 Tax=Amylocarpus encephaloides TaxID=45428 RepID=A0A9P7YIM1_9HELO|nr:hypothetical protein BJ875DRAFT_441229 [Amylocarpus encephaloides]
MAAPEIDISQLSEAQQLALQQYTSVTDQDIQAAVPLLRRSQWNVEIAVAKFFDGEGPDLVAEAVAAQNVPPPRAPRRENLQQNLLRGQINALREEHRPDAAPRIVPQPESQAIPQPSILLAILFTPFQLLYKMIAAPIRYFLYLFPFLRIFPRNPTTGTLRRVNTSGRRPLSPSDASQRVQRELAEEYGEIELPWSNVGYATSLDHIKREFSFLLVVLISPEHDDTSTFCRETLMNPEVVAFLHDPNNMIRLWVGDVRDAEAYQVSTALKCNKFPFTALICNTPEVGSTAVSVVLRNVGPMEPTVYLAKLRSVHATRSSQLETGRANYALQNSERNLRREQDSAYERSLAQDRERARQRKEAEEAVQRAEKLKLEEEANATLLAEKRQQWRRWRASQVLSEPGPDEKDIVRIALKMPEAARVIRRFRASDPIDELYSFVECYEIIQDGGSSEKTPGKPSDYKHEFAFRIVSTLPRVVYDIADGGRIGEKVGKSGNLIVEPIVYHEE